MKSLRLLRLLPLVLCLKGTIVMCDSPMTVPRVKCSPHVLSLARDFADGTGALSVLYFGNSRTFYCYAAGGLARFARERGILTGSSLVMGGPRAVYQNKIHGSVIKRYATDGEALWTPEHCDSTLTYNTYHTDGFILPEPGRYIQPYPIGEQTGIDPSDTLRYNFLLRRGPDEGACEVLLRAGNDSASLETYDLLEVTAADTGTPYTELVRVTLKPAPCRTLEIRCTSGRVIIYGFNVRSSAAPGWMTGQMSIGGIGYPVQMRTEESHEDPRCPRADYITHIRSADPDVVIIQYANNQQAGGAEWKSSVRELLGRIAEAKQGKEFLTVFQIDNTLPDSNSGRLRDSSIVFFNQIAASWDNYVIADPQPHLPDDWPQPGEEGAGYTINPPHENDRGSREVFNALLADIRQSLRDLPVRHLPLRGRGVTTGFDRPVVNVGQRGISIRSDKGVFNAGGRRIMRGIERVRRGPNQGNRSNH